MTRFACVVLCTLLLSCGGSASFDLAIDLRTDYVPGLDFGLVVVDADGRSENVGAIGTPESISEHRRGRRVATFEDVSEGQVDVRVTLLRPSDGGEVASRRLRLTLDRDTVATVVISQLCSRVECPASDPLATECVDGVCVPPECSPENPEACPDAGCGDDAQCDGSRLAECARAVCAAGSCLIERDDEACEAGFVCDPTDGCTPDSGPACGSECDPGVPCRFGIVDCSSTPACRVDETSPPGSPCTIGGELGMCDLDGECATDCVPDIPCPRPGQCERGITQCVGGETLCQTAGPEDAGVSCRAVIGACDVEEQCDGESLECPTDTFLDEGVGCREPAGPCELAGECTGAFGQCPARTFAVGGTACTLEDDTPGFCDGMTALCQDGCIPGAPCAPSACETGEFVCGDPVRCEPTGVVPNGMRCADPVFGDWSGCGYPSTCAETGSENRPVVRSACASGICEASPSLENRDCSRVTEGVSCAAGLSCPGFGLCEFSDTCAESGLERRDCTNSRCNSGSCQATVVPEMRECTRPSRDGTGCGSCGTSVCICDATSCETVFGDVTLRTDGASATGSCGGFDSCSLSGPDGSCVLRCPLGEAMPITCTDLPGGDNAAHIFSSGMECDCVRGGTASCSIDAADGLDIDCSVDERC